MSYLIKANQSISVVVKNDNHKKETLMLLKNKKYLVKDIKNEQINILKKSGTIVVRTATQSEEASLEMLEMF